jgi:hypothetical protein
MAKETQEQEVTYSEYAVNIFKDKDTEHWFFSTVNFDPVTKAVGAVLIEDCGPSKDEAVQRFKLFSGRNFL